MGLIIKTIPNSNLKIDPAVQKSLNKIKSVREAMVVLINVYGKEINRGRVVARMIAKTQGTVHAGQMVAHMVAEGSLVEGALPEHWVSVVFRGKEWKWTGNLTPRKSVNTQGGYRGIKVWALK